MAVKILTPNPKYLFHFLLSLFIMTNEDFDIENVFEELETLYQKYDLPKMHLFLPNKLEINLERKGINEFNLVYREFFDYLPDTIQKIAIEITIQILKMIYKGINITRIENGIMIQMSGDYQVAYSPIIEILFQNKYYETNIKSHYDEINKHMQIYSRFFILNWECNKEAEQELYKYLEKIRTIFEKNPSIQSEIENIFKKYQNKTKEKD